MKKLLVVVIAALVIAAPARASSITLTGPTSITVPEDGASHDFTYTFSNNSGASLTGLGLVNPTGFILTGDVTDLPIFQDLPRGGFNFFEWGASGSTCSFTLGGSFADGASCTLILRFLSPDGSGETDANFGTVSFFATLDNPAASYAGAVIFGDPVSGQVTFVLSPLTTVTITDPGFITAVPEPASLTLTALGLAGVLARYRRRRHPPSSL